MFIVILTEACRASLLRDSDHSATHDHGYFPFPKDLVSSRFDHEGQLQQVYAFSSAMDDVPRREPEHVAHTCSTKQGRSTPGKYTILGHKKKQKAMNPYVPRLLGEEQLCVCTEADNGGKVPNTCGHLYNRYTTYHKADDAPLQ